MRLIGCDEANRIDVMRLIGAFRDLRERAKEWN